MTFCLLSGKEGNSEREGVVFELGGGWDWKVSGFQ